MQEGPVCSKVLVWFSVPLVFEPLTLPKWQEPVLQRWGNIHKICKSLLITPWSHLGISSDQGESDFPLKCVANWGTINFLNSIKYLPWISLLAPQLWVCRSKDLGCYTGLQRMCSAEGKKLQFTLVSHWAEKSWGFCLKIGGEKARKKPNNHQTQIFGIFKTFLPVSELSCVIHLTFSNTTLPWREWAI